MNSIQPIESSPKDKGDIKIFAEREKHTAPQLTMGLSEEVEPFTSFKEPGGAGFYCYIITDISNNVESHAKIAGFTKTRMVRGYFSFNARILDANVNYSLFHQYLSRLMG